jgi:hypothetical protein
MSFLPKEFWKVAEAIPLLRPLSKDQFASPNQPRVHLTFASFPLIPQPLLPFWEKGSPFKVPRPQGEGFRERECKVGMHPPAQSFKMSNFLYKKCLGYGLNAPEARSANFMSFCEFTLVQVQKWSFAWGSFQISSWTRRIR